MAYNGELDGSGCKFFGAFAKIYTLSSSDGEIFYVGCTIKSLETRLRAHLSSAKKGDDARRLKIRELNFNISIKAVDILWVTSRNAYQALAKAFPLERKWIQKLSDLGHPLVNKPAVSLEKACSSLDEYQMWLNKKETGLADEQILEEEKAHA